MDKNSYKQITCFISLLIITCFSIEIPAEEEYDYNHRKRDCEITLIAPGNVPLPGALIGLRLLKNDFSLGGTMQNEGFDTLGDDYGEQFLKYFDIATPENEMKWENTMKCSKKCDPDFSKADSLIAWLQRNKIPVRGYNLFSNEKEERLPEWTRNLGTAEFKQAMQERIDTVMNHFKGKIFLWDLISEICHEEDGSFLSSNMLETRSGDPNIVSWILDEARKRDSTANFMINDYALITSSDQTAADKFINKIKPLSSKFQIVGSKAHFGASMNKSSWEPKINYLAQQLGNSVWLTDVDFSVDINQAPEKIEELMRTCFANPNVTGLTIGSWYQHYMPHSDLTNYFIDTLNNETPTGKRWREVRDEWKTDTGGQTDESGKFKFNGFQGEYLIHISCYVDTFYLEPGEGIKSVKVTYRSDAAIEQKPVQQKTTHITINGKTVPIRLPVHYSGQLFLTTWSLSGQQLSHSPINSAGNKNMIYSTSSSCRIFRIETSDRQPFHTGKITPTR